MNTALQERPGRRLPSTSPHIRTHAGRPVGPRDEGPSSVSSAGRAQVQVHPLHPLLTITRQTPRVSWRLRPTQAALPAASSSQSQRLQKFQLKQGKALLCVRAVRPAQARGTS